MLIAQQSKFVLVLVLVAFASCKGKKTTTTDQAAPQETRTSACTYPILADLDKRVKAEKIPATNVLSLQFSGNYQKHPEAYAQLKEYAEKNYATTGGIVGIYPQDPDLVQDESQLTWEINLRIVPGKPGAVEFTPTKADDPFDIKIPTELQNVPITNFTEPAKQYRLKQLPAIETVSLISDVAHIGQDGLAINAWIDLNNYVQTGTTRTEFGSATQKSQLIPVKIMVPVKKRTRETIKK